MIHLSEATKATVAQLCSDALTEEQARIICAQGPEAIVFALLRLSALARSAAQPAPGTPSGQVPPYQKAHTPRRKKKPGRKNGHLGAWRITPEMITHRQRHTLAACPQCGTELGGKPPVATRTRIIEDIPEEIKPEITEHTIDRHWCPKCNKIVEPPVAEALPRATIGNHLLALTAWLHYGLGNTLAQIIAVLSCHLHFQLSPGGLIGLWHRLANILNGWYEAIAEEARQSAVLNVDETSWRVAGHTDWLWCFTNARLTYYLIDPGRSARVLIRFFAEEFQGTLIADFLGAYNRLATKAKQRCLVHLLREMETVEQRKDTSGDWPAFRKLLRRLLGDALRLKRREELGSDHFVALKERLERRLDDLLNTAWLNGNARRLCKRLRRHRREMFTFLEQAGVSADNNHAEREIRPAVIMRKNILGNRSRKGARTQAILMSVYRTLKLRRHDPIKTICAAVAMYLRTGSLPPLPV